MLLDSYGNYFTHLTASSIADRQRDCIDAGASIVMQARHHKAIAKGIFDELTVVVLPSPQLTLAV